jgi:DNA-binding XRE family transcriptional regulator
MTDALRIKKKRNNVRALREEILMSKAELARRAGVSPLTVDRIESGMNCRLDTKRKIILALGKKLNEKDEVFPDLAQRAHLKRHSPIQSSAAEEPSEDPTE